MGSPVSPPVANLFMEDFEEKALAACENPPRFWGRYVDDVGSVIKQLLIDPFLEFLNSRHPAIKFTMEREEDGHLAMLDVMMERQQDGHLKFKVYRKPTHTDQYLDFSSHQPLQHKLGVIRTLHYRAQILCSEEETKLDRHLKR